MHLHLSKPEWLNIFGRLSARKKILSAITAIIILISLPITIFLVKNNTQIKSQASAKEITVGGSNIKFNRGMPEVIDPNQSIELGLQTPFAPPAPVQ